MSSITHRRLGHSALGLAATLVLATFSPLAAQSFTVTTLADSGAGSLRDAIDFANGDGVPTVITFDLGLAGGTIVLASQLPDLTEDGTTIDGDFDADCDADIGIDGSSAGPGADGSALVSNNHVVRGLAFFDFDGDGLHVQGSNNLVACNYFGTDLAAAGGHGNGQFGIRHVAGNDNQIGPYNVVAYNGEFGISVTEFGIYVDPLFTGLTPDDTRAYPLIDFTDGCGSFASTDGIVPTDGSGAPFTENFGMRLTGELALGDTGDYLFEIPQLDDEARLLVDSVERLSGPGPGPLSVTVGLAAGTHTLELDFFEGGGAATVTLAISGPGSAALSTGASPPAGCGASQPGLCGELFQLRIPSERNTITQNSIHDNTAGGITLSCCCTPMQNDPGDADLGANGALNHPEINSVVSVGGGLFTVSGTAPPAATVEIFRSDMIPPATARAVTSEDRSPRTPWASSPATFRSSWAIRCSRRPRPTRPATPPSSDPTSRPPPALTW